MERPNPFVGTKFYPTCEDDEAQPTKIEGRMGCLAVSTPFRRIASMKRQTVPISSTYRPGILTFLKPQKRLKNDNTKICQTAASALFNIISAYRWLLLQLSNSLSVSPSIHIFSFLF